MSEHTCLKSNNGKHCLCTSWSDTRGTFHKCCWCGYVEAPEAQQEHGPYRMEGPTFQTDSTGASS